MTVLSYKVQELLYFSPSYTVCTSWIYKHGLTVSVKHLGRNKEVSQPIKKRKNICRGLFSLVWLVCDHFVGVSVKRVKLMLSVTYCSQKNSYFGPNNWQIKSKDQETKRKMTLSQSRVIVGSCHFSACSQFWRWEVSSVLHCKLSITKFCKLWVVCSQFCF